MKIYRWAAVALVLMAGSPALAIDFDRSVTQITGEPFTDGKPEDATLRKIVTNALLATYQDEPNLKVEDKLTRFFLAKKIQDTKGDVILTADEVVVIKALVAKSYPTLIAGQALILIDPGLKR